MTDYEFRLFCSELERYAAKRYTDTPDAETYIVCAADQLQAEGITFLPHPELHESRWLRIDEVLDENTSVPELVDA